MAADNGKLEWNLAADSSGRNEVKKDCFAYDEEKEKKGQCKVLTVLDCMNRDCKFYKTKEQFEEDRRRCERRRK